eukprot:scaffold15623_cov186-Alexandrium_tamarense.AAC.1
MNSTELATRAYMQFNDISAKFSATARVSGSISLGESTLGVDDGVIAFGFGFGMVERSDKIFFRDISSASLAMRENGKWNQVGGMDISLPVNVSIGALGGSLNLKPLISITDSDLLGPDSPAISIDFDVGELFDGGENIIGSLLEQLTGGLADISSGGIPDFSGGPLGEIQGVLDGFGLNLTSMFEEFKSYYDDFKSDILSGGSEYQAL